jgi:hypothetical protein
MIVGSHQDETEFEKWGSPCSTPTDEYSKPCGAWKHNHIRLNTGEQVLWQRHTFKLPCRHPVRYVVLHTAMAQIAGYTDHRTGLCPVLGSLTYLTESPGSQQESPLTVCRIQWLARTLERFSGIVHHRSDICYLRCTPTKHWKGNRASHSICVEATKEGASDYD